MTELVGNGMTEFAERVSDNEVASKSSIDLELKVENLEKEVQELKELVIKLTKGRQNINTKAQGSGGTDEGFGLLPIKTGGQSSLFMSESNIENRKRIWLS